MALDDGDLYVAGHWAPAGRYRRVEPPDGRTVVLEVGDLLPGSLDGRVATYERVPSPPAFLLKRPPTEPSVARGRHAVGTA
jgi:hypothetical protein